jgi:hypothetical protein
MQSRTFWGSSDRVAPMNSTERADPSIPEAAEGPESPLSGRLDPPSP